MSSNVVQNSNSSIDWNLAVKLAGNKTELAREMITMFTSSLHDEINFITKAKNLCNMEEVQRRIHKLHGGASYCGVPNLKEMLATCETLLKKKLYAEFNSAFAELKLEANNVTTAAYALAQAG